MKNSERGFTAKNFRGIDFEESPLAPSGKMYFMNEHYIDFRAPAPTAWQRFKTWVRRLLGRK